MRTQNRLDPFALILFEAPPPSSAAFLIKALIALSAWVKASLFVAK
jgi:hypothetical protein